jgi:hypothetical protein
VAAERHAHFVEWRNVGQTSMPMHGTIGRQLCAGRMRLTLERFVVGGAVTPETVDCACT